ncbi:hypothetical protein FD729_00650 [Pantoea sp. Nvir]|nr:hypothetical protein [Pantoea sp. Nvir]
MNQEHTEYEKSILSKLLGSGSFLRGLFFVFFLLLSVYLMVSLVSFNPSDPSWLQTAWNKKISNFGGRIGAWLADTLFFIFGIIAYVIPLVIISLFWIISRQYEKQSGFDYFEIGLRLIGMLLLIFTTCGLAALNANDIFYFASGGVIGSLVSYIIALRFSPLTGTLILLCTLAAGITIYTGWSWMTIVEHIGRVVVYILHCDNCLCDNEFSKNKKKAVVVNNTSPNLTSKVTEFIEDK